jgi:hypothetical protein
MRKSVVVTQVMIAVLCAAAMLLGGMAFVPMLVFLVTMEIGAVAGVWWGRRLRAKMQSMPLR